MGKCVLKKLKKSLPEIHMYPIICGSGSLAGKDQLVKFIVCSAVWRRLSRSGESMKEEGAKEGSEGGGGGGKRSNLGRESARTQ